MSKFKKIGVLAVASVMCLSTLLLVDCGNNNRNDGKKDEEEEEVYIIPETLDFTEQVQNESWEYVESTSGGYNVKYYTVDKVVYCTNPTHPDQQSMRFYVPADHFNQDGSYNKEKTVNGYTVETAPIIYLNNFSGYQGDAPWYITTNFRLAGACNKYYSWYYNYLNQGFVLVFVGERGKTTYDEEGKNVGVAPISLADLKAGIRFLKYNSDKVPGDTDKIISNGVSAGGAMSALIGVTGNYDYFKPYLEEMGAYVGEDADDSVFATQVYCPITDLDHGNFAYEWMWQSDEMTKSYTGWKGAMCELMAKRYASYINSLNLMDEDSNNLLINEDGSHSGSFYEWFVKQYEASYNHYVEINGNTDASEYTWLSYDDTAKAKITSLADMIASGYNARQKACFSFDAPDYTGGSNLTFGKYGSKKGDSDATRHFTADMPALIAELKDEYPDEYDLYYQAYYDEANDPDMIKAVYAYNPYYFIIDKDMNQTDFSEHFRVNVGTQDRDASPTVSAVYSILLANAGFDVEYNLIWNQIHIDADYEGEFEAWVNKICKQS